MIERLALRCKTTCICTHIGTLALRCEIEPACLHYGSRGEGIYDNRANTLATNDNDCNTVRF